mmetsp:Transcript_24681/g.49544  ORF Transcript_24681/g.49544 Transcript_24681/m.49544 type:complete len:128 (+) Transcript_24681:201-584(+)
MNGLYNQVAQLLKYRSDAEVAVVPAGYPAAPIYQLAANIVGCLQILLMVMLFMNDKAMPEPLRENKMAAIFGIYLGSSLVSSALTTSKAFEIYVGKKLVFSQLAVGRTPNREDLIRGFASVGITLHM